LHLAFEVCQPICQDICRRFFCRSPRFASQATLLVPATFTPKNKLVGMIKSIIVLLLAVMVAGQTANCPVAPNSYVAGTDLFPVKLYPRKSHHAPKVGLTRQN